MGTEPLSNLDAKLPSDSHELSSLQSRLAVTTFYVTHRQVEGEIGDDGANRVGAVLRERHPAQCGHAVRALPTRGQNLHSFGVIGSRP